MRELIQDYSLFVAELLFWITDGVPLVANPFFFLGWIFLTTLIMFVPVWKAVHYAHENRLRTHIWMLVTSALFFPVLLLSMGPALAQDRLMRECQQVPASVEMEEFGVIEFEVTKCRSRENRFDEFGDWEIR